jgi:hypothetical protein
MNKIVEKKLTYHFSDHSWYLSSNKTSRLGEHKTVFWGANQVPLSITVGGNPPSLGKRVQFRSLLQFNMSKPILGPLVGILTAQGSRHPFTGVKSNFIDIIKTGKRKGAIVFVFTPESIDWKKERIEGYLYHQGQRSWIKVLFPIPNVVYNRISTRNFEDEPESQRCITRLQQFSGVTLFNPHFFNKEELFSILEKSPTLATNLPKTASLRSVQDLQDMLQSFKHVYLKPTQGKAGSGIIKVSYDPTSHKYQLYVQKKQFSKPRQTKSISKLWTAARKHLISSPYIVQQGISLAQINGCPFDCRTLVQKDKQGIWQVTGLGIRVAGANRITTHVPRGGRIEAPDTVLGQIFPLPKAKEIQDNVKKLALAIAEDLDRHYSHLGEMSMDIGVDKDGELWFFEANSKPMKFDEPNIRQKSLENIISYSQYLTFVRSQGGARKHAIAQPN